MSVYVWNRCVGVVHVHMLLVLLCIRECNSECAAVCHILHGICTHELCL